MTVYVILIRAVNVGGTSKLPMATLIGLCEAAGLARVRTYIASGNVICAAAAGADDIRVRLEAQLHGHAGRPVGVIVRTADEIAGVVARNPFPDAPGNRVIALFTDDPLPADPLEGASGRRDELVVRGVRELYVHYPGGIGPSRLRLPAEKRGTARSMNTVARLAIMAREGQPD